RARRRRHRLSRPADLAELARGDLRRPGARERAMSWRACWAIYVFEMARTARTIGQSIVAPVITTALYFVVFVSAIGLRIQEIEGAAYGASLVPALVLLSVVTPTVSNASFGVYFPRCTSTLHET